MPNQRKSKEEKRFIVAEVSKNWNSDANMELLSQRFELVIAVNLQRGYVLMDWKLDRVFDGNNINETIIAIFEKISLTTKS